MFDANVCDSRRITMSVIKPLTVAGCQIQQELGNRDVNIKTGMDAIRSNPDHDIYVLPELSSTGYGEPVFQQLKSLAEDWDGPSFEAFSKLSRELSCYICYSFPRRRTADEFTIAATVVGPTGDIEAKYDKWHVCSTGVCCERDYFENGKTPLEVFDALGVRVGLCICYDIRFPELARELTVEKQISLLLHPGGWPRDQGFHTWHTFVTTRAVENTIYIMSTNWAGQENGHTVFCPPFVDGQEFRLNKLESEPGLLVGTVDVDHLERVRKTYTYLEDRNRSMYNEKGM
jgi:predicted amidohydrolase